MPSSSCKSTAAVLIWLYGLLVFAPQPGMASCECGYTASNPWNNETWLFTETLETDFTNLENIKQDTRWVGQSFTVSAGDGRGEYGKVFVPSNAVARPELGSQGQRINDIAEAGLELLVNSVTVNDSVLGAEIDSIRLDLHYGSYRAGMRVPSVKGTCAAFFWYFNDTQEIDIEFLSQHFDSSKGLYPVSLVIQSEASKKAGYDASKTGMYKVVNLTFDPTAEFHEYRFDYLPDHVFFYVDSVLVADMYGTEVPSVGGHLILQHWSNGNPLWSGGPPSQDASLKINYVKAYFNSSDSGRLDEATKGCTPEVVSGERVCSIPDAVASDVISRGEFLSQQDREEGEESAAKNTGAAHNKETDEADSGQALSLDAWTGKFVTAGGLGLAILMLMGALL